MTNTAELVANTVSFAPVVYKPDALDVFMRPENAATLWQRTLSREFQSWIDQLPPENLPEGRLILRKQSVFDAVYQLCEMAEMTNCPERDQFVNDVSFLSGLFADLMSVKYLKLRLDKITDDSCCKFHRDSVTARLVCTYRGTGTQYGTSRCGNEPSDVQTVPTGSPFLMRGTLWPEKPNSGLRHRSPPIKGTGETRLLLVLDPVLDP